MLEILETYIGLHGRQLLSVAAFLAATLVCYHLLKRGLYSMTNRGLIAHPVYCLLKGGLKWSLALVVIVVVLQNAGLNISNIIGGLLAVLGMVAVGFIAVWSILSNILCAFVLIAFKMFQIGDEVEILEPVGTTGLKGTVLGFNVMYTTLAQADKETGEPLYTQVPNNIFFQKALRRKLAANPESLSQHMLTRPINFWARK